MNDNGRSRAHRYAKSMTDANWVIDPGASGGQAGVGFWLHSCSIVFGPRLVGQLTLEGYKEMQAGFPEVTLGETNPFDVLGAALSEFDSIALAARSATDSTLLASALALYARATRTWDRLPQISTTSNIHFLVFDWHISKIDRIMLPAAIVSPDMLSPESLNHIGVRVLNEHLINNPNEAPIY